ncbi:hypothetical protein [Natranaeroarchaeum aerophilus]|uniref:PGF-CTERM sorting domain-containing protein n=1 Tax=Natranaeroarchaeum aerophilus TaxID=2917711 RepID=A0AAE3FNW8_9EURY|nr:hypothetical protein [Natranaeroarchaeum aerophilus]MCL9812897.1 hypothetical protein [Natranaeroarchaeum aerophilus]
MEQDLEAHYVLGNDIDATSTDNWNAGAGFDPIAEDTIGSGSGPAFSGTLDGQGHTISGLVINRPGEQYTGLFSGLSGTVKNTKLEDVEVSGNRYAGSAVGHLTGEVRSVAVTGQVESSDEPVGGVVARSSEGVITRVSADIDVSGEGRAGIIVGSGGATISQSYSTGTVRATDGRAGGIVGYHIGSSQIRNSYSSAEVVGDTVGGVAGHVDAPVASTYASGPVDGTEEVGGFAGEVHVDSPSPSDTYWSIDSSGTTTGTSVMNTGEEPAQEYSTGLGQAEMTGAAAEQNMNLNFEEYWTTTDEYPILQWQVEDVDLSVTQSTIGEGESTSATVELVLHDGSTVTASEVADYDSETAIASVDDGSVEANSIGQTDITATVAGQSDTVSVEVLEPPSIEFLDAQLDTETVVEGTTAQVSTTYENTGGPGSETVSVAVADEQASITTFQLDADEETAETITWSADDEGMVSLDDEELAELEVVDPANVTLQSVELHEEATQDREYEIEPVFETDLDTSVWTTLELRVDGDRVLEDEFEVSEDGAVDSIKYAHDEDGTTTHVVEHYDETQTGTVEVLPPADFELDDLEVSEAVEQGDTETVSVTVRNVGGGIDDADITLALDGEEVDTQAVTLDRNEDTTIELDAAFDDADDVDLTVSSPDDEMTQSVTVEAGERNGDDEADDDGLPGFTAVAGLLAVLLTAGSIARRR